MDTLIGCFLPDKEHEEMADKTTDTIKNRRTFDPAFKSSALHSGASSSMRVGSGFLLIKTDLSGVGLVQADDPHGITT